MMSREEAKKRAAAMIEAAGIAVTQTEKDNLEIADFRLGELERTGLEIVIYENNDRYCAKELVLFPHQTCPEHRHPAIAGQSGKRETFRVRKGVVYLYVPGKKTDKIKAKVPEGSEKYYTVFHEVVLKPGEQYTIQPDTLHWFQSGAEGAIVSEFSSTSRDEADIFTDPRILRVG